MDVEKPDGDTAREQRVEGEEPIDERDPPKPERGVPFKAGNPFRFAAGVSGNPHGRPREVVTREVRKMLDEDPRLVKALAQSTLKHAMAGRSAIYRDLMERLEGRIPYVVETKETEPESMFELRLVVVEATIPEAKPNGKIIDVETQKEVTTLLPE